MARQALLSMGSSRQEYWSELPHPPPGDLPDPGTEPTSLTLAGGFFITVPPGKPTHIHRLGFAGGSDGKASACNVGDGVRSLGREDPLKKEMATHSSVPA